MAIHTHLLALLVLVGMPLIALLRERKSDDAPEELETGQKIATYWVNGLFLLLLAGAALLSWHDSGGSIRELGLTARPERMGWGLTLALLFSLLYAADAWRQLRPSRIAATRARWRRDTPFMPTTSREVRHSLVLVLSASVGEEILYRGFVVCYLAHFVGTTPWGLTFAVALPAVLFAICHCYQGAHAVAKIALLASLFGAIFVVTGSLWVPMLLHFLVDLLGMLLGQKLMAEERPSVRASG